MPKTLTLTAVLFIALSTHASAFVGSPFPGVPGPFPELDAFETSKDADTVTRDRVTSDKSAPRVPERNDR